MLFLNSNLFVRFPNIILALGNTLEGLYLSGNQLEVLPDDISSLGKLMGLRISWNRLTSLPESIGKLTRLGTLILDGNNLVMLPVSLINCTNLARLSVLHNPIQHPPPHIQHASQQLFYLRYLSKGHGMGDDDC